jgi:hypothetical protein
MNIAAAAAPAQTALSTHSDVRICIGSFISMVRNRSSSFSAGDGGSKLFHDNLDLIDVSA